MRATGGKSICGTTLGISIPDARFPRIPGDMGNALTWPFPVHYGIVRSATPGLVVLKSAARHEGLRYLRQGAMRSPAISMPNRAGTAMTEMTMALVRMAR